MGLVGVPPLSRTVSGPSWRTPINDRVSTLDGTVWLLGHLDLPPPVDLDLAHQTGDTFGAVMEWRADADRAANSALARFAGGAWEWWEPDDLPDTGLGIALEERKPDPLRQRALAIDDGALLATFMAAPDGSLWASRWQRGPDGEEPPAGGLWAGL